MQDQPFYEDIHSVMIQGRSRSVSWEKDQKSHGNPKGEDGAPVCGQQSRLHRDTITLKSALARKVLVVTQGLTDFSPFYSINGLRYFFTLNDDDD